MNEIRSFINKTLMLIAISLFLSGCAATIKSSGTPLLQGGSPLRSIKPKVFAIKEFRNTTDVKPGVFKTFVVHKVMLKDPVEILVSDAIRRELERNGHKCIDIGPYSQVDFIIEGSVYKYWLMTDIAIYVEAKGIVAVKLTISHESRKEDIFIKNYDGEYVQRSHRMTMDDFVEIMNEALRDMINKISTDEQLIAFLNK